MISILSLPIILRILCDERLGKYKPYLLPLYLTSFFIIGFGFYVNNVDYNNLGIASIISLMVVTVKERLTKRDTWYVLIPALFSLFEVLGISLSEQVVFLSTFITIYHFMIDSEFSPVTIMPLALIGLQETGLSLNVINPLALLCLLYCQFCVLGAKTFEKKLTSVTLFTILANFFVIESEILFYFKLLALLFLIAGRWNWYSPLIFSLLLLIDPSKKVATGLFLVLPVMTTLIMMTLSELRSVVLNVEKNEEGKLILGHTKILGFLSLIYMMSGFPGSLVSFYGVKDVFNGENIFFIVFFFVINYLRRLTYLGQDLKRNNDSKGYLLLALPGLLSLLAGFSEIGIFSFYYGLIPLVLFTIVLLFLFTKTNFQSYFDRAEKELNFSLPTMRPFVASMSKDIIESSPLNNSISPFVIPKNLYALLVVFSLMVFIFLRFLWF